MTDINAEAIQGLSLTEYNRTQPALSVASTISSADTRFQQFTQTGTTQKVDGLLPASNLTTGSYLSKTTQVAVLYDGYLTVPETGNYIFANVGDDYVDIAVDGKVVSWRNVGGLGLKLMNAVENVNSNGQPDQNQRATFLSKGKHSFRARMIQISGALGLSAYWKTPAAPNTFVRIPNELFQIKVDSLQLAPQPFSVVTAKQKSDDVPLLIYRSAVFTVKKIGQHPSKGVLAGATNTISVTFQPQFELTGTANAVVTISGLLGSVTPDSRIRLLDTGAVFSSTAAWAAKSGTLVLSVAPGQTVPSTSATVVRFDLDNPTIPQTGATSIFISAHGDVPIAATPMTIARGNAVPLRVHAASFTQVPFPALLSTLLAMSLI